MLLGSRGLDRLVSLTYSEGRKHAPSLFSFEQEQTRARTCRREAADFET
jgi:hypothetical protein